MSPPSFIACLKTLAPDDSRHKTSSQHSSLPIVHAGHTVRNQSTPHKVPVRGFMTTNRWELFCCLPGFLESICCRKRSNEFYPDHGETAPVFHRVIPGPWYTEYLLSGDNGPWFTADDIVYGEKAGGEEVAYALRFLAPCDPFYTSRCMLGEYRPFLGFEIGRNGPPGADYYTLPDLMPLGNLLKASYVHEGNPEDLQAVRAAIDRRTKRYDATRLIQYGEQKLYREFRAARAVKQHAYWAMRREPDQ